MASREVRRLVFARLPLWGSIQRDGPLAPPRAETAGGAFGSRLPVPAWYLDLSRAFAQLNPHTAGVGHDGNFAGFLHLPFNDLQQTIWQTYVVGADVPLDLRRADRQHWAHDREREIAKEQKARGWRLDDEIGQRLHITGRKARSLRMNAVWLMATLVNWDDEAGIEADDPLAS